MISVESGDLARGGTMTVEEWNARAEWLRREQREYQAIINPISTTMAEYLNIINGSGPSLTFTDAPTPVGIESIRTESEERGAAAERQRILAELAKIVPTESYTRREWQWEAKGAHAMLAKVEKIVSGEPVKKPRD